MQRILFLFQFWCTNLKGAQPAKASAADGDAANAPALQVVKQRARACCNQGWPAVQNAALASDSQCQRAAVG